jgi:flagellar hook assembly protein FlgD
VLQPRFAVKHFIRAPPGWPAADAELTLYDVTGREIRRLHRGSLADGLHPWEWPARDDAGRRVASGVYLARFRVGREASTLKVIVR